LLKNKEIRKRAAEILLESGGLYKLAIGCCLCIWFCILPIVLFYMPLEMISTYCESSGFTKTLEIILIVLLIAYYPTVSFPIAGGLLSFSYRLLNGERKIHISEIFSPFTSIKHYLRVLFGVFTVIVKLIVFVLPAVLFVIAVMIYQNAVADVEATALRILFDVFLSLAFFSLMLLATVGLWMAQNPFFLTPYLLCRGTGVCDSIKLSCRIMKGSNIDRLTFAFGFVPLFLLSAATLGMLFVVYTAPVYMIAYLIYAENKMKNYEKIKEVENNGEQG